MSVPVQGLDMETITVEQVKPGIYLATLNRPERLNAMTNTMFREFEQLAFTLNLIDEARVLILTGAGRAFCAGFDLDEAEKLPTMTPIEFLDQQELAARGLLAIRSLRIPVIAAVNGAAAGGGLSLALAADIRMGTSNTKFNAAFVRIGLSAGDLGASWMLPRIMGPARASEFCYTARMMGADEAYDTGLLNHVVPEADLIQSCIEMAEEIAKNSPGGVQLSKRALQANMEVTSYAAALELENRGQALLTQGEDMPEALAAFKEKRTPNFTGR